MLQIGKILKRSWKILWSYKILWLFGLLLAATGGSGSSANFGGQSSGTRGSSGFQGVNPNASTNPTLVQFNAWFQQYIEPLFQHPERYIATFVWIGVIVFAFLVIVGGLATLIRYVAQTSVLRMVDEHEQSGSKVGFKQGWRLGWSRAAFRSWLMDLLIYALPVLIFTLLAVGLGVGIYYVASGHVTATGVIGLVIGILVFTLVSLAFGLAMVVVSVAREFMLRKVALEGQGVTEAIGLGWQMFRRNWKNAGLMWLVMFGLGIGFGIAMLILLIVLIPVLILTGLAGLIVAAVPALIGFGITNLFAHGLLAWIVAIAIGLPFFALVFSSPLLLINGWMQVFTSSVWTLTYRELKALESLGPTPSAPAPEAPATPLPPLAE